MKRTAGPGAALLLPLVAALCLGATACERKTTVEEHRARVAVREYNLALPRAYRRRNLDLLAERATENERGRIWPLILGLSQRGLVLDSRQEQQETESIKLTGEGQAELITSEIWWYRHLNPTTGRVGRPPGRVRYRVRYIVVRQKNRWLVDRVRILSSSELPRAE